MRPQFHYAPKLNWLSDPNGLVFHEGEWHLFYQYNPQGEDWGHMSWGHAVSKNLAHWEELTPALLEDDRHMIFSGAAVADPKNSGGFGENALVAIYTGAALGPKQHQVQCLASSTDRGRNWEKYAGNPVLDLAMADFRDPNVFWHDASERWIMVVALSNEQCALIYASRDFKQWVKMSVIRGTGAPGEVWECPLLIELPVEGTGETRWLFKVDVLRGAPGSGALYQTGTFDGIGFTPDASPNAPAWQVADMGCDFYAAIAWHEPRDEEGRPVWIGWMGNHAYQGRLPLQGWRGAMSVPRRLSLRRDGSVWRLRQEIERSVLSLAPSADFRADTVPAVARIELPDDNDYTFALRDDSGRQLVIERRLNTLVVIRTDPASPFLDAVQRSEVEEIGPIQVLLDVGSIELFARRGEFALTLQHRLQGETYAQQYLALKEGLAA